MRGAINSLKEHFLGCQLGVAIAVFVVFWFGGSS
jgi:hypothetical protein